MGPRNTFNEIIENESHILEMADTDIVNMNNENLISKLKRDLSISKEKQESFKKAYEDLQSQTKYKENQFYVSLKQKEDLISLNNNVIEELKTSNELLGIRANTNENEFNIVNEEVRRSKLENKKMSEKINELMTQQQNFDNVVDGILKEKYVLQNQLDNLTRTDSDKKC